MIAAMSPSSTVEVLLSTHNGERYIATQLASILSQLHTDIRVVVRDDASTDRTVALVQAIADEDRRVRIVAGPRLGWAGSFMALLALSGEARWLAFSDQDDVWLPDKLTRAVAALAPLDDDRPALYGSAMLHVTDELRWLSVTRPPRRVSFENALVQNVVAGCTMVFNRAARALCLERVPPPAVHDWWLYLITTALGTVIFDEAVTVLHRVHAGNATAVPLWGYWLRRVTTHLKLPPDRRPSRLVRDFYETYSDRLNDQQRAMVEELLALHGVSWLSRARYARRSPLYRQSAVDDVIFRVLLVLGRF
jgi:glycosyltransferase involved in cell wall biosynthesis